MPLTITDESPLEGKTVLISGGTTGIGRALAKKLVREGARVFIFGRHERELLDAIAEIKAEGPDSISGMVADQAVYEDLEGVFSRVDEQLGGLDILVNNASVAAGSISESQYAEWKYVVETNLLGYMSCCSLAMDRMRPKKEGHIVNIGSMSADAEDSSSVYVATKTGVRGFTKSLAPEANKLGIRVTLIEPGLVGTDMTAERVEQQEQWQAQGKMLKAEDIADCVAYAIKAPERCNVEFVQIRPRVEQE